MNNIICHITNKIIEEGHRGDLIRKEIFRLIQKDYPDFRQDSYISIEELNHYRKIYLASLIKKETHELNDLEQEVVEAISINKILSKDIEIGFEKDLTFGQNLADKFAKFAGSWTFIICFFLFITFWVVVNILLLTVKPFDPYPFILLNLILSCLAAIQAPIIIMSQNRLEEKDRKRGEHDYKVNLKAELEIRLLDEKMDHLVMHQYKRMLEVQELQMDYLEDILKQFEVNSSIGNSPKTK
ncbi:MAG: DUF1003 domain-containing protein [Gammaproteobacteria bacterium]|nr:DUF1003 domain-containing protein [Gammaproteobacteria bacterium]